MTAPVFLKSPRMIIVFLLFAVTVTVYWPVQRHAFILWDDPGYVYENSHLTGAIDMKGLLWALTDTHMGHWHPLTWLSHMGDVALFGLDPAGHHTMNLFFHIGSGILLFLLFQRMTGANGKSAFMAALFLLHPLNVESVAWVSERKNVLSALLGMLTMWAYVFYVEKPTPFRYVAVFFSLVLGLLAKPMLVTLPFILLLLDIWPLRRWPLISGSGMPWKLFVEKAPLLMLSILSIGMTLYAASAVSTIATAEAVPLSARVSNALISYAKYLELMIWPRDLAFFYPHPVTWSWGQLTFSGAVLILISAGVCCKGRAYPYLIIGWLWYLGSLIPVIGIVQAGSQAMADRYAYLSLIGIFIMGAWGIPDLLRGFAGWRPTLAAVACLMLCSFVWATSRQLSYWQNSLTLFYQAIQVNSMNYVAHNLYGQALMEQERLPEAIAHFQAAIRAKADFGSAYSNLGLALMRQDRFEQAIPVLLQAVRFAPKDAEVHFRLADALFKIDRTEEAVIMYRRAADLRPGWSKAQNNLGIALARQDRDDEAADAFLHAMAQDPGHAGARNNLAMIRMKQGRTEEAIALLREALHLRPNFANAHYQLSESLMRKGRSAEARFHAREAARLNPLYGTE